MDIYDPINSYRKNKFYFLNCENLKNVYYINQFITFKTKNIDELRIYSASFYYILLTTLTKYT